MSDAPREIPPPHPAGVDVRCELCPKWAAWFYRYDMAPGATVEECIRYILMDHKAEAHAERR